MIHTSSGFFSCFQRVKQTGSKRDPAAEAGILTAAESLRGAGKAKGMEETARIVEKIRKEMADEETVSSMEEELAGMIAKKAEEIDFSDAHRDCEIRIKRTRATEENIRRYELCRAEVTATLKRLMARMEPVLERYRDSMERGMPFGKRLDGRHLYRQDRRIFMSRSRPCERKNAAVAVLMDESASMALEGRIETGRFLALVLYEFCKRLDIPILVMGHSTARDLSSSEPVEIYSYAEFDSVDGMDRYRLMGIRARLNNRDGAALQYAGARLQERQEEQKLLFVVTDGLPCASGYTGTGAKNDIRKLRKCLEREGIRVIAAAIGSDREEIRNIYGESFLNISDLKRLPDTMAGLITGYLER